MDPELRELLELAERARAAGKDTATINLAIREETGGRYEDLPSLKTAVQAMRDLRQDKPSAVSDLARMAAQGATFGFADEIVGAVAGDDAMDRSRRRVERVRDERPVASLVAEALGGSWLPGGAGASVGRSVIRSTGSRVLGGLAGGSAGGLLGGAATGAGEAEGGLLERAEGGVLGGLLGAAAGGALGAGGGLIARKLNNARSVGAIARNRISDALEAVGTDIRDVPAKVRALGDGSVVADLGENLGRMARSAVNAAPDLAAPGGPKAQIRARNADTGERIATELRRASGLSDSYDESLGAAKKAVEEVRETFYRPLEASFPAVQTPGVAQALSDPQVASVVKRVAPEVASGKRPPSFTELQDVLMDLRDRASAARASGRPNASRKATAAHDALREAMETDIPEFGKAQAAFRVAAKRVEAHELGGKLAFRGVREIREQMAKLPEEARDAFRQGMLDRYENALVDTRGGGPTARKLVDGGRGVTARLKLLAQSDPAFKKLISGLEREDRWRSTWRALSGNSTTAEQISDSFTLAQIPTDKRQIVQRLLMWVEGTDAQRRDAAKLVGRVLMSDGENAARALAADLALKSSRAGVAGAIGGSTTSGQSFKPEGLLR